MIYQYIPTSTIMAQRDPSDERIGGAKTFFGTGMGVGVNVEFWRFN
jgi:hypothetical protein